MTRRGIIFKLKTNCIINDVNIEENLNNIGLTQDNYRFDGTVLYSFWS